MMSVSEIHDFVDPGLCAFITTTTRLTPSSGWKVGSRREMRRLAKSCCAPGERRRVESSKPKLDCGGISDNPMSTWTTLWTVEPYDHMILDSKNQPHCQSQSTSRRRPCPHQPRARRARELARKPRQILSSGMFLRCGWPYGASIQTSQLSRLLPRSTVPYTRVLNSPEKSDMTGAAKVFKAKLTIASSPLTTMSLALLTVASVGVLSAFAKSPAQRDPLSSTSPEAWEQLRRKVDGRLYAGVPFAQQCFDDSTSEACLVARRAYLDESVCCGPFCTS